MENLKHTKGEWIADKEEGNWEVYCNRTRNICSIKNRISIEGNSENEANAKLIASAPELLEALIEAEKTISSYDNNFRDEKVKSLITNAINKATK
jgi:hypothetical protein